MRSFVTVNNGLKHEPILQLLDFFILSDNLLLHIDSNFSEPLEDIF